MKRKLVVKTMAGMISAALLVSAAGCSIEENKGSQAAESAVESVVESAAESIVESVAEESTEAASEESTEAASEESTEVSEEAKEDTKEDTKEDAKEETDEVAESTEDVAKEVAKEEKPIVAEYYRISVEELDGQYVSAEYTYTFYEDHTGVADVQDTVEFTWDDEKITEGGVEYKYYIQGDCLMIERDGFLEAYPKK